MRYDLLPNLFAITESSTWCRGESSQVRHRSSLIMARGLPYGESTARRPAW